jgi:hypothetical protein
VSGVPWLPGSHNYALRLGFKANELAPSPVCGETTVFWPDVEACDAVCMLPAEHDGPHEDEVLGEWEV